MVRYNTWDFANANITPTLAQAQDAHGFQNFPVGGGGTATQGQTGTMMLEWYGNTIANAGANALIVFRGGA